MNSHPTSHFKLSLSPLQSSPSPMVVLNPEMMNRRFAFVNQHQNTTNNNAGGETLNGVVCPKPRRFPSLKESSLQIYQTEICELKARTDILDMILTKECYDDEKANNFVQSSPPFFYGSPPNRASNPLVQDSMFGKEDPNPFSHAFEGSPSSSARGSCARGQKHPAVRVVGFKSRGISAVA